MMGRVAVTELRGNHLPGVLFYARLEIVLAPRSGAVHHTFRRRGNDPSNERQTMRDPKTLSDAELDFAIDDAAITAHAMDSLDRVDGIDRAGKYRDECAALRAEKWARCKSCKGRGHVQDQHVNKVWFTMNLGCNCCGKPAIGVVS